MYNIALASKSPRRREILDSIGYGYKIVDVDVDETPIPSESPRDMSLRLACAKSEAGSRVSDGLITLGADTVVDVDGNSFGKPRDREEAFKMLSVLSGRDHLVHTGVALSKNGILLSSDVVTTKVSFGILSEGSIKRFIDLGIADDKAGAYAIQGIGALFVRGIEGCWLNVVGLPAFRLNEMMRELERSGEVACPTR